MGFDDLVAGLVSATDTVLGDEITITRPGEAPQTLQAFVDVNPGTLVAGISRMALDKPRCELSKYLFPEKPTRDDRITTPAIPGELFRPEPADEEDDLGGTVWVFYLVADV